MNDNFAKLPILNRAIQIPNNVIVPCAITGIQTNRLAANCCQQCKYFVGIAQLAWADDEAEQAEIEKHPWPSIYAIRCNMVMELICQEFKK